MRRLLVGGNWKMNGSIELVNQFKSLQPNDRVQVVLFPPFPYLTLCRDTWNVDIGAQNVNGEAKKGAQTGEVSPQMLKELQVPWVLIGHSERRSLFHEDEQLEEARRAGLKVVYCVGESETQRIDGETENVIAAQLQTVQAVLDAECIIAYEPVWAIGTGKVATPKQAQQVHSQIRKWLEDKDLIQVPVIYGGSVTDHNCTELVNQPDIDGFLVGGASLNLEAFGKIVESLASKSH